MTARNHHYLSQCYLKGFTKGSSKKSKLTVIDFKHKKYFETIPRNVGGIRDFNRIEIDGVDQNAVENSLASFEGRVACALKRIEETLKFDGEDKDFIINLIALLATRSPEMRENLRRSHEELLEIMLGLTLETKERWEFEMKKMKESGREVDDNITYEDIKEFFDRKEHKIELSTQYHIHMEMVGINAIIPCLFARKWILVKATKETGLFITSDKPVNLTWNEPDKIPPFFRNSPGFGMSDTHVYFPISKQLALIGNFDGRDGLIEGDKQFVAVLNSKMLGSFYKQIYTPKIGFNFIGKGGAILNGSELLKHLNIQLNN